MQFSTIFLSLALATSALAKGGKGNSTTKAVTDKSLCKEMKSLNKLVELASNETRLADKTNNNATKIASIQAKASEASVTLATMEANTTLTMTCSVMAAAEQTKDDCEDITDMTKLIALAANETALAAKSNGNTTKEDNIKAKAVKAQTKLDALTSNTTLMSACTEIAATKAAKKAAKNNGTSTENSQAATDSTATGASASASSSSKSSATRTVFTLRENFGFVSTIALVIAGMLVL